ncbi:formate-nitrite transporter [Floricoccus tropicus]|uniref:Formate-nitrite transporter n=1 Tax=Floricoccus tropicus TaxID=1859473 RepID=A0A1E8GNC5_9LACT|nr:formate/nitrite transporter family protein [Floricoccus tropicus]OFI49755.1 formate-nitrite transporter [Floricoccus tropicus]
MKSPEEILEYASDLSVAKVKKPLLSKLILAFIGGAMVSMGYMTYLRVAAAIPGGAGVLAGAALFPTGLVAIMLGGAELATSNMMVVGLGYLRKRVTLKDVLLNWLTVTSMNIVGAIFVAGVLGIGAQVLTGKPYLDFAINVAHHKIDVAFLTAFLSGIGCNWLVGMAAWVAYGAKDAAGKILAIWFIITIFVVLGFQHSVANSFVIPFAIFEGAATWGQFVGNFIPVFLGNVVGGVGLVSLLFSVAYKKH